MWQKNFYLYHAGSVTDILFSDGSFYAVSAFQIIEYLPYEIALEGYRQMRCVNGGGAI